MSFNKNRIREVKKGKEISKSTKDVEIHVWCNGEEEETIDNEGPTITKVNIHEYKAKSTMYWNHCMGEVA